jgi:hypothetical protein
VKDWRCEKQLTISVAIRSIWWFNRLNDGKRQMKSAIVWNIETVPDLECYARVHKLEGKTEYDIRG